MTHYRFAIIGAGIAGASLAFRLSEALGGGSDIIVLEREDQPGYHSTGRSAAVYTETYGPPVIRALTAGSRRLFDDPPTGFAEVPLLHDLGLLLIARESARDLANETFRACRQLTPTVQFLEHDEIAALNPVIRPEWRNCAVYEPDAMSMDVAALHSGYLRGFKAMGGLVQTDADVAGLTRTDDTWRIDTRGEPIFADVIVNAAGAWADEMAELAGTRRLGLQPKRRTAIVFQALDEQDVADWPMVNDIEETFYFKPDAGRILASPEEETPMPPCDIQPDEYDIAVTVDRLERATTLSVPRIDNAWAGLRSFFPDGVPSIGFDGHAPGFFWLAGQGGYGITISDASARLATALLLQQAMPDDLSELGVDAAVLSPARFD